jgi:predicted amidohydrolase
VGLRETSNGIASKVRVIDHIIERMRLKTIEMIGFLHCVDTGRPGPIAKLQEVIEKKVARERTNDPEWRIANSLIVLPEAFNLGEYCKESTPAPPQEFLAALQRLADRWQITFVAGVLDGRLNSASIIDGRNAEVMSYKTGDDLTGVYDPYTGDADPCNPIDFVNASVGTLICMDADDASRSHHQFFERLKERHGHKIVCIPGRFNYARKPFDFSELKEGWYIVAQGRFSHEMGSFIADFKHDRKVEANGVDEVGLWRLPAMASTIQTEPSITSE